MDLLQSILHREIYQGIDLSHILSFAACLLGGLLTSSFLSTALSRWAKRLGDGNWRYAFVNSLAKPIRWALLLAGVWVGSMILLERMVDDWSTSRAIRYFIASEIPFVLWAGLRLINDLCEVWIRHADRTESTFDDQLVPIVRTSARVAIVLVGTLFFLQLLEYPVGSLLAGLGIGGMAVALAAKDTLANLFGSLVILIDRPFTVGDWVEIGAHEGTVEEVGLRVTRIRTFANSLISIPNGGLTTQPVNNWSRMKKRRIMLTIGVTYDATPEQLEAGVQFLRDTLRDDPKILQDFYLVNFHNFGASSLDLFVYCFTETTNWAEYLQARQELLLKFMHGLRALGLSFAFPTQTLHLQSPPGTALAPNAPAHLQNELPR